MWFIIVVIFLFLIGPRLIAWLLRWWIMRKMRRQSEDLFEQFARATGHRPDDPEPSRNKKSRKGGWQRADHEKKIHADEGEYVDYDEVTVTIDESTTVTDGTSSSTSYTHVEATERRVEDVEWEDL